MQISTSSSPEISTMERGEYTCPLRCPLCSGSLVPLHNSYRCARCSYPLCAGCEQSSPEPLNNSFV